MPTDSEGNLALWKIHINVSRDSNDPTTAALVAYCEANKDKIATYKVGSDSGQDGKGMTVYFHDRRIMETVADEMLKLKVGGKPISLPSPGADVRRDDIPVKGNLWARFYIAGARPEGSMGYSEDPIKGAWDGPHRMHQYGAYGLPMLDVDMERIARDRRDPTSPVNKDREAFEKGALTKSYKILAEHFGEAFTGVPKGQTPAWAQWLFDDTQKTPLWVARSPTAPLAAQKPAAAPPAAPPMPPTAPLPETALKRAALNATAGDDATIRRNFDARFKEAMQSLPNSPQKQAIADAGPVTRAALVKTHWDARRGADGTLLDANAPAVHEATAKFAATTANVAEFEHQYLQPLEAQARDPKFAARDAGYAPRSRPTGPATGGHGADGERHPSRPGQRETMPPSMDEPGADRLNTPLRQREALAGMQRGTQQQPSVVIVTDTDVAAVPYDTTAGISFRLDRNNKGPFAAMLPLSDVLNPAKADHCIESLRTQFATVPLSQMRDVFLATNGYAYIVSALDKADADQVLEKLGWQNDPRAVEVKQTLQRAKSTGADADIEAFQTSFLKLAGDRTASLDEAGRAKLFTDIAALTQAHHIQKPFSGSNLGPKAMDYAVEDILAAEKLARSPDAIAREQYEHIKAVAQRRGEQPGASLDPTHARQIQQALAETPPWVQKTANANCLKIVVAPNTVDINDIVPNNMGIMMQNQLVGCSTGQGVYVKPQLLGAPSMMGEEIIHEVERGHRDGAFSLRPEWKNGLNSDLAGGNVNLRSQLLKETAGFLRERMPVSEIDTSHLGPIRSRIVKFFIDKGMFGATKANVGFTASSIIETNPAAYTEALVDLNHMASMVKQQIDTKGSYTMRGRFGFGGKTYTSVDAVMNEAFPSAWKLMHGPAEGMALAQRADGSVSQIAIGADAGNAKPVISLRECCERESSQPRPPSVAQTPIHEVKKPASQYTLLPSATEEIAFAKQHGLLEVVEERYARGAKDYDTPSKMLKIIVPNSEHARALQAKITAEYGRIPSLDTGIGTTGEWAVGLLLEDAHRLKLIAPDTSLPPRVTSDAYAVYEGRKVELKSAPGADLPGRPSGPVTGGHGRGGFGHAVSGDRISPGGDLPARDPNSELQQRVALAGMQREANSQISSLLVQIPLSDNRVVADLTTLDPAAREQFAESLKRQGKTLISAEDIKTLSLEDKTQILQALGRLGEGKINSGANNPIFARHANIIIKTFESIQLPDSFLQTQRPRHEAFIQWLAENKAQKFVGQWDKKTNQQRLEFLQNVVDAQSRIYESDPVALVPKAFPAGNHAGHLKLSGGVGNAIEYSIALDSTVRDVDILDPRMKNVQVVYINTSAGEPLHENGAKILEYIIHEGSHVQQEKLARQYRQGEIKPGHPMYEMARIFHANDHRHGIYIDPSTNHDYYVWNPTEVEAARRAAVTMRLATEKEKTIQASVEQPGQPARAAAAPVSGGTQHDGERHPSRPGQRETMPRGMDEEGLRFDRASRLGERVALSKMNGTGTAAGQNPPGAGAQNTVPPAAPPAGQAASSTTPNTAAPPPATPAAPQATASAQAPASPRNTGGITGHAGVGAWRLYQGLTGTAEHLQKGEYLGAALSGTDAGVNLADTAARAAEALRGRPVIPPALSTAIQRGSTAVNIATAGYRIGKENSAEDMAMRGLGIVGEFGVAVVAAKVTTAGLGALGVKAVGLGAVATIGLPVAAGVGAVIGAAYGANKLMDAAYGDNDSRFSDPTRGPKHQYVIGAARNLENMLRGGKATFDEKGNLDFTNPENKEKLRRGLEHMIGYNEHETKSTGWARWKVWNEADKERIRHNDAVTDLQYYKSALAQLDGYADEMAKYQHARKQFSQAVKESERILKPYEQSQQELAERFKALTGKELGASTPQYQAAQRKVEELRGRRTNSDAPDKFEELRAEAKLLDTKRGHLAARNTQMEKGLEEYARQTEQLTQRVARMEQAAATELPKPNHKRVGAMTASQEAFLEAQRRYVEHSATAQANQNNADPAEGVRLEKNFQLARMNALKAEQDYFRDREAQLRPFVKEPELAALERSPQSPGRGNGQNNNIPVFSKENMAQGLSPQPRETNPIANKMGSMLGDPRVSMAIEQFNKVAGRFFSGDTSQLPAGPGATPGAVVIAKDNQR